MQEFFEAIEKLKKINFVDSRIFTYTHNYISSITKNLQLYLEKGLVKSKFLNLKIRQLSAETSHDFIEWCGLIEGDTDNPSLEKNVRRYKQDLYLEFIGEYPDYAPKAKMTISRNRFYKWLNAYSNYKYNCPPDEGRDREGRWIRFRSKHELEVQGTIDGI